MDELFTIYSRALESVAGLGGRALAARRDEPEAAWRALDPGQGARPAARAAARRDPQPRRHLRLRAGLRAAAAADARLAAAGGARVRRDDPRRAEAGDAELRRPGRAARPRRRVGRLPRASAARRPSAGSRASASTAARATDAPSVELIHVEGGEEELLAASLFESAGRPRRRSATGVATLRPDERAQVIAELAGERPTAATARAAAGRRSATASRSSPTTAASATSSATGC